MCVFFSNINTGKSTVRWQVFEQNTFLDFWNIILLPSTAFTSLKAKNGYLITISLTPMQL